MKQSGSFKQSNKGESLVLVTIFSTIVIGIVVTLTVISAMLFSNAGKQKSQDQAYELATSLSDKIEELILHKDENGKPDPQINLDYCAKLTSNNGDNGVIISDSGFAGIPDSTVKATIVSNGNYYELTVTATAGRETYIKKTLYSGDNVTGYTRR